MQTRGIKIGSTMNAVFNTIELLENILNHLSANDIIRARRVNRHWNGLILASPHLCRKLYLQPTSRRPSAVFDTKLKKFRKLQEGDDLTSRQLIKTGTINPVLFKHLPANRRPTLHHRYRVCETLILQARPDLKKEKSLLHHMYICMPPAEKVEFEFVFRQHKAKARDGTNGDEKGYDFRYYGEDKRVRMRVSNAEGVKFKHVLDAFVSMVDCPGEELVVQVRGSRVWVPEIVFPSEEELEELNGLAVEGSEFVAEGNKKK